MIRGPGHEASPSYKLKLHGLNWRAIIVLQVGSTFSTEDEPQESIARATFLSLVRPYLVVGGTAVFVN